MMGCNDECPEAGPEHENRHRETSASSTEPHSYVHRIDPATRPKPE
jgi:hypothetical protein